MVVVVVFGVVGVVLLGVALKMYASVRAQRGRGVRLVAEVVSHGDYISHGQTMYVPIYAATVDGTRVEGQAATTMAKTWRSPKVGTKRTIIYRAGEDPPFSELGFVPLLPTLIMGVLGAGFLIGAIALGVAASHHVDRDAAKQDDASDRKRIHDEKREQRQQERELRDQERDQRRAAHSATP